MDRREERKSDAELLLSLLPRGAEFRKGRKKYAENNQIYLFIFIFLRKIVSLSVEWRDNLTMHSL